MKSLRIDGQIPTPAPLPHLWSECVGAGRANEALRAKWQEQLQRCIQRIGFRQIRFHGLFHDDMFVYRGSRSSGFDPAVPLDEPLLTFSYIDMVFDFLLEAGITPFVELGFMPADIATKRATLFWWNANCSPPTDMAKWTWMVSETIRHWIDRYGIEVVGKWRFEVWNEPNLVPHFWTGTRTEYFELYEATVRAIKNIDSRLMVGGPSTSVFVPDSRYAGEYEDRTVQVATAEAEDVDALDWQPVWIREFLQWCAERSVPVDFVTTHTYPTDFAYGADDESVPIFRQVNATLDDLTLLKEIIESSAYPQAEIHITEWSSSPSSRDFMHDSVCAATYITRTYLQCLGLADSLSYWTFTDIFEEGGAGVGPFHGGFGIINEQGIYKPTFHAFSMLSDLGEEILLSTSTGVISRNGPSEVSAVFFNYPDEMENAGIGSASSATEALAKGEIGSSRRVAHSIQGLTPGDRYVIRILDHDSGNVLGAWEKMGGPLNLSLEQTSRLREVGEHLRCTEVQVDGEGMLSLDVELAPWAVCSLTRGGGC